MSDTRTPAEPSASQDGPSTEENQASSGRRTARTVVIGATAGVAVLLIAGAGAAIALAFNNATSTERLADAPLTDSNTESSAPSPSLSASAEGVGGVSAAPALIEAITRALDAVEGEVGATAVEIVRDGWEVDVAMSDGTETAVHVDISGATNVLESERDGDLEPVIDISRVSAIVDAAIAAADGGNIESISTDDGGRHLYEATVDLGNGREVEVRLSDDLTVVSVDTD